MSGITGILRLDGTPVSQEVLGRMTDAMKHRGPDGAGCWAEGNLGFGHTVFRTTPESLNERQPLVDDVAGLALVWDGRIDNREELCTALNLRPADVTDVLLALRAYERWGKDFLPRILGDFALGLSDRRQRRLLCARDVLGQRPLYYWFDGKTFLFASEFQPLFEFPGVSREPNLRQAARWLSNGMEVEDETLYKGILRVRSAQAVLVDGNGLRKLCYWKPDPEKKIRYGRHEKYAEHFGALFQEAVRCRLRTTGTVGVLVSGGLDSTSIACMAQKLRNEGAVEHGVQTFSTIYDTLPCDERQYIQSGVEKWKLNATLNVYERQPEWLDFGLMSRFPDAFYSPTDHVQEFSQMRDRGIRVCLDGIGGDELLAPDLSCITDWVRRLKLVRAYRQLRVASTVYGSSMTRFGLMYCVAPFVPKRVKRFTKPLVQRANGVMGSVLCRAYQNSSREPDATHVPEFAEPRCRFTYESFCIGSSPMAVEFQELIACRFPMECRRPFADRKLLQFTLSIPDDEVWRTGEPIKTILRDAMKDVLPEKVCRRTTEAEFSPLIERELRHRQRTEVDRLVRESYLVKLGVVERDRLQDAWKRYYEESNASAASVVMCALGWELWYRSSILNRTEKAGWMKQPPSEDKPN